MQTIWGKSDSVIRILRGLSFVSTPSHGGFAVSEGFGRKHLSINAQTRGEFRNGYFWFEEDCDYAIVMLELYDLFLSIDVVKFPVNVPTKDVLIKSLSHYHADYLIERGIQPDLEGLQVFNDNKQSDRMRADKSPDLIVSASGDRKAGVPKDMVEVTTADGATHLVWAAEYDKRNTNLTLLSTFTSVPTKLIVYEAPVSYAPEVIADNSGKWAGNGLRFATKEEAEANVRDLMMRWFLVRETRVVESTDPVNYRWTVNGLEKI